MADQLFKKNQISRQKREKKAIKQRSETWLFVCEGTKTEPNYIKSLISYANQLTKESPLKIQVEGVGRNTESLVNCVDDFFDYADKFSSYKQGIPFAKTFVMFDKDSFKPHQFNNAIVMAKRKGYIPIWSNECFELWYILHYDYYCSNNGREAYFDRLTQLIGVDYDKSDDIFSLINSSTRLKKAMQNARKLERESCNYKSASERVPCTQMFILINEIQKRLRIDLTMEIQ